MSFSAITRSCERRACGVPMLLLFMLLAFAAAGCGVSGAGGTPTSTQGTLSGKVIARPTCPVERADQPCQPAPIAHRAVSIERPDGTVVATVTTDAQGQFSATLDPGSYVVHVAIVRGQPGLRQLTPGDVTILAGKTTPVTITLDTGIRSRSTP
jgi:hypothetical protein